MRPPANPKRDGAPSSPLRDEIALRVMTALIGDAEGLLDHIRNGHAEQSFKNIAAISYDLADAMMEARKR